MANTEATVRSAARIDYAAIHRWIAAALVGLVLVQAFLGGRGFFVRYGLLAVHEQLGRGIFAVALAGAVVAALGARRRQLERPSLLLALALPVLVAVQFTLGYNSQTHAEAAAWHLPTGVLIFGLAVASWFVGRPTRGMSR